MPLKRKPSNDGRNTRRCPHPQNPQNGNGYTRHRLFGQKEIPYVVPTRQPILLPPDMVPRPLRKPHRRHTTRHDPSKPRYYYLAIVKMVRLLRRQSEFLGKVQHFKHALGNTQLVKYQAISHRIGATYANLANRTSTNLVFFYTASQTIRGKCIVTTPDMVKVPVQINCLILGVEYRQNAQSFRLYIAYFSPTRYQEIVYTRFLVKRLLCERGLPHQLTQLIMEYICHGLVRSGFEIVGCHFLHPKAAREQPSRSSLGPGSYQPRYYTNMWNAKLQETTQHQLNFIVKHARRDIQVHKLQVDPKMYAELICGTPHTPHTPHTSCMDPKKLAFQSKKQKDLFITKTLPCR